LSEVVVGHAVPPSTGTIQPNLLLFCGETPLSAIMADRGGDGRASVILATVRLTGVHAAEPAGGPPIYRKMILDSVRTLSGRAVPDGAVGWINSHSYYEPSLPLDRQPRYSDDLGALWGPEGRVFAFYEWDSYAVGPRLVLAPVVGDQVVFSQAGCWNVDGLPNRPYRGAVAQVPGSHTYELAAQATMGLRAVPLEVILGLATG
jgi:hypothetical protein